MTVYVDDMYQSPMGRCGRMKMSHMQADSSIELLEMADAIGLDHRWLQKPGHPTHEHFDVSMSYRQRAIDRGAVPVSMKALARWRLGKAHG